ncbi:MAG: hypothetical protein JWR80_1599 [Bradyrhizobium sp.]|nr:hypothetical protein [Bradyrhizobium sp.]
MRTSASFGPPWTSARSRSRSAAQQDAGTRSSRKACGSPHSASASKRSRVVRRKRGTKTGASDDGDGVSTESFMGRVLHACNPFSKVRQMLRVELTQVDVPPGGSRGGRTKARQRMVGRAFLPVRAPPAAAFHQIRHAPVRGPGPAHNQAARRPCHLLSQCCGSRGRESTPGCLRVREFALVKDLAHPVLEEGFDRSAPL